VVRCAFAILLGVLALPHQIAQSPPNAEVFPVVSVLFPANVRSETVQISYFLRGPFGGYGGYSTQKAGVHSYEIPTVVKGKPATEIRMIVYASGCEIQSFTIPLSEDSLIKQDFQCQRVATARLSGEIVPSELVRDKNTELVVTYMAYWAHEFYGIADGIVTELKVATVAPAANGMFQVDLPYFAADAASPSQPRASFQLMLRDSKTWNHIASNLEPETQALRFQAHGLRIRSQYPDDILFTMPEPFVELIPIKGKVFRSDSGEPISNSYIFISSETDAAKHFDTRTDEKGEYLFGGIPAGNYTASIYAWFPKRSDVPCQNPREQKTVDGADITVEWQWKSRAFMEIVTLNRLSVEFGRENVKDFDLVGR
jgi:hypothetical protein